jgi:hypothetical protein
LLVGVAHSETPSNVYITKFNSSAPEFADVSSQAFDRAAKWLE